MKYASFIANWVLGVLFFIISLLAIINSSFLSGLLLLIASLTLMPISRRFVLPKINEKMSPTIRAAFVSILFIGFVVSVQPNEAQLLAQKEIKLAEETALLEQQKIAKAAGFLSVEEYKKAKSVAMPTKALYDTFLTQQAELKLNEEKRKTEQKRLTAEAENNRKAEEAKTLRLVAAEEAVKRKANAAEKARLTANAKEVREAGEADNARLALELESDNNLIHNINNLRLFLRCTGFEGTHEGNAHYWVGMGTPEVPSPFGGSMPSADVDIFYAKFRFPRWDRVTYGSSRFVFEVNNAFLFYYDNNEPDPFIDDMQYVGLVTEKDSSFGFEDLVSVAAYSSLSDIKTKTSIDRKSGILKIIEREDGYVFKYEYNCSPVSEADREKIFTILYRNLHNYAFNKYDEHLKYLKSEKAKKKKF